MSRRIKLSLVPLDSRLTQVLPALLLVLLAALLAFQSSPGRSTISWRGDFETGNLTQWDNGVQRKEVSRVTVVSAPLRQGRYAARFEVRPGDNNVAGSKTGERAEVLITSATTEASEGREQFWAWSTYFPSNFAAPTGSWNAFTQFHHTGTTGQVPIHFAVSDMKALTLRVMGGSLTAPARKDFVLAPLQKGSWYDLVFHVKWSSNASVGFVEVWLNGSKVVPKTFTPTLYSGMTAYAKQGYYRAAHDETTVVYQDGMRRGSSYDEVASEFPGGPIDVFGVTSSIANGSTLSKTVQWTASPSGKTASSVTFSVDGSVVGTDTAAPFTLSLDTTKLTNSSHAFRVEAVASDGSKASASANATVDNPLSRPLSVQQNLVNGQAVSGSIPWTATTSGKAASKIEFYVDGQLVGTDTGSSSFGVDDEFLGQYSITIDTKRFANGSYPFAVKAFATDGSTATATVTVTVDNPVAAALFVQQNLVDGQTVSGSIAWTATTSGKTVSKVEFSVNGQSIAADADAPYAVTLDTKRFANGKYPFAVKAFATDGTTATASASVNVSNPISSPLFVQQSLVDGQTVSGTIPWTATTSGKTVSKVEFSVSGQSIATDSDVPYVISLDTKRFTNGSYPFAVKAFAIDGSTATATATATVMNATANNFSVTQNVADGLTIPDTYRWTAIPAGKEVSNVVFLIDGEKVGEDRNDPYDMNVNTRKLSEGKHTFRVTAIADDDSTTATSADVNVANRVPPIQPANTLQVSQSISSGGVLSGSVVWTAAPRGTVTRIEFWIDGNLSWTERDAPYVYGGDGAEFDTRTVANGKHRFEVTAYTADGSSAKATAIGVISNGSTSSGSDSGGTSDSGRDGSGSASENDSGTNSNPELVSSIRDGQRISGLVAWTVEVNGFTVSTMEFLVDGKLMWTERIAPWVYAGDGRQFDTSPFAKGSHVLELRATGTDGWVRTLKIRVTIV